MFFREWCAKRCGWRNLVAAEADRLVTAHGMRQLDVGNV